MTHAERRRRREEIAAAVQAGETPAEVAYRFGVTQSLVSRACEGLGLPRRQGGKARRAEAAAAVAAGESPKDVAARYDRVLDWVHRSCWEAGVPYRTGNSVGLSTYRIIAALLRGERQVDIARQFGMSRQRVGQVREHCLAAGIPLPE